MATESFFSSASLAYVASAGAGKDGKAYSMKPVDGTGDFTFSRGSNLAATRVGPTGLIEKGRENLLTYSNTFNHATWSYVNITLTSGQTGYDGSSDAWLVSKSGANANLAKSVSLGDVHTTSVYAKQGTGANNLLILTLNGGSCYFDLDGGSVNANTGLISASIEDMGNGWYRCSIAEANTISAVRFYPALNGSRAETTGAIYLQDAQLEIGLAATDYIESGATTGKAGLLEDEPRFDYSGGATCPSLLLEPSRTQLIGNSELINPTIDTTWKQVGSNTFTNNYGISPDGSKNSTLIEFGGTTSSYQAYYQAAVTAGAHTISIYAKGSGSFKLGIYDNASILTDTITLTSDWQRFEVTKTTAATSAARCVWLYPNGDGDTIEVWGVQTEAGSYPTSYIPNHSGGTITRGADLATGAGTSSTFNDSEGVLFIDLKTTKNASPAQITLNDGTYSNRIIFEVRPDAAFIKALINSGGSNVYEASVSSAPNTNYKVAIKYSANDIAFFVNGVKETFTTTTTAMPIGLADISFTGRESDGALRFNGEIKQTLVFNEALSDADCITLTTI